MQDRPEILDITAAEVLTGDIWDEGRQVIAMCRDENEMRITVGMTPAWNDPSIEDFVLYPTDKVRVMRPYYGRLYSRPLEGGEWKEIAKLRAPLVIARQVPVEPGPPVVPWRPVGEPSPEAELPAEPRPPWAPPHPEPIEPKSTYSP